ncbi:MAG: hypothetical protein HY885_08560 [Deltaproteobacteria bacterium]|nr:hypothetical protein [Deltaproteobacteria bacterium]
MTPREKMFLRAMAGLGAGTYRTGDVAGKLKVKTSALGPLRAGLIKKGMVYSPSYGDMAFTVPLFDEFL